MLLLCREPILFSIFLFAKDLEIYELILSIEMKHSGLQQRIDLQLKLFNLK